jgi:hypothetical protein
MIGSIGALARHDLLNGDRAVLRPGAKHGSDSFLVSAMAGHASKARAGWARHGQLAWFSWYVR